MLAMAAGLGAGAGMPPATAYADRLQLIQRADGSEVEIVEEQAEVFVIKIPKSEVASITRETPTEVKLWKEKKILWEDQGDYVVISLPKERIAPPPSAAEGGQEHAYATASSLSEGLAATGQTGRTSRLGLLTGDVTGRVLRRGRPLAGCRVKLAAIQGPSAELSRLLGGRTSGGKGPTEATTGANGVYLFEDVPIGDYDISWLPPDSTHWLGRLSEAPDVTVRADEVEQQGDVEL